MNFLTYIILLTTNIAFASLAYDYGASASLFGLNGLSNFNEEDAVNAHALPALMANTDKSLFSINLNSIIFDLKEFDNIIIASNINSSQTSPLFGGHDPNPTNSLLLSGHGSFKLFKSIPGKLNVSFYTPVDKIAEIQTGDPYLPEYPMLKKLERFMFEFSYAHKFNNFSFSIGALGGIQSKGETFVVAKDNGSPVPSSAEITQNATPSLSLNFSLMKKTKNETVFFKFQDEVKSKLENDIDSFLFAGGGTISINWQMSSLMFYDPRTIELGAEFYPSDSMSILSSLEIQSWSGFETPKLNLKQTGGILVSSDDEVNFTTKFVLVPTIALSQRFDNYTLNYSYKYQPSPLGLFNNRNGNTIDLDRSILALGFSRGFTIDQDKFNLSLGIQYHYLHPKEVNKSGNAEDGTSGEKIGAGGYTAKGQIFATSLGINWVI